MALTKRLFITGTGTGVGKTWVARGLARALANDGHSVSAIKPIETGCNPEPLDAVALARACGRQELVHAKGFYRIEPPLAPYAATLLGAPSPPTIDELVHSIEASTKDDGVVLIEGAGGVLVPLDANHTMADLIVALSAPALLVTRNALGVLSFALTALESLQRRNIEVSAIALCENSASPDLSQQSNVAVLADLTQLPVCAVPQSSDDDEQLARLARNSGLLEACHL